MSKNTNVFRCEKSLSGEGFFDATIIFSSSELCERIHRGIAGFCAKNKIEIVDVFDCEKEKEHRPVVVAVTYPNEAGPAVNKLYHFCVNRFVARNLFRLERLMNDGNVRIH